MPSPVELAQALTPRWMMEILDCDGLEIHPVRDLFWNDDEEGTRPFQGDPHRKTCCEVCQPEKAHFWSVYGHCRTGGVECFDDFPTEAEARRFAEWLLAAYPHLHTFGLMG